MEDARSRGQVRLEGAAAAWAAFTALLDDFSADFSNHHAPAAP